MKWLLRLCGLVILAFILWRVDIDGIWERLRECRFDLAIAALGINLLAILVKSIRWHWLLRMQKLHCALGRSVRSYFASVFFGLATPGRLGELSRAADVHLFSGESVAMGLSSVVIDRLMDLYALFLVGFAAIFHFGLARSLSPLFIAISAMVAVIPILFVSPSTGRAILRRTFGQWAGRRVGSVITERAEDFLNGVERLLGPGLLTAVALTLSAYVLFFVGAHVLASSIGLNLTFPEVALTVGLANLLSIIPVSVAGIGTRDAVFVLCFASMGLRDSDAVGFSAMVLAVFYAATAVAASPFFLTARFEKRAGPHDSPSA